MNYQKLELLVSAPRLARYLKASGDNKEKAVKLYFMQGVFSGYCFNLISLFEVILRNKINEFEKRNLADDNWLITFSKAGSLFDKRSSEHTFRSLKKAREQLKSRRILTNDQMVNTMDFGFWSGLFQPVQYTDLGSNLVTLFHNAPLVATLLADVHKRINAIRRKRNQIAHNQPIIFDQTDTINFTEVDQIESYIDEVTVWLGEDTDIYREAKNNLNTKKTLIQNTIQTKTTSP